jgi:hypothetical protein
MTRGKLLRLIWIDAFVETSECLLQREHICVTFDLSVPQASIDLRDFQALFPARLAYDKSAKGYRAAEGSAAVFDLAAHSAVFLACAAAARAADALDAQNARRAP